MFKMRALNTEVISMKFNLSKDVRNMMESLFLFCSSFALKLVKQKIPSTERNGPAM